MIKPRCHASLGLKGGRGPGQWCSEASRLKLANSKFYRLTGRYVIKSRFKLHVGEE